MADTLAQNCGETVVVRIFVVLDGADPAEELIGTPSVDVSPRTAGLGRVVIEIPIKMDCMRPDVLQLGAGPFPQFLSPGQVPLIELLGRQVWAHRNRPHIGPGSARYWRTRASAWSGVGESQEACCLTVVVDGGG